MPLKVKIDLGDKVFEAEGDFNFDEGFITVFRQWINAIDETPGKIENLADRLEDQSSQLGEAVASHTPIVTPPTT